MNQSFHDAIQDFDLQTEARGLSDATRRWYIHQVEQFGEFIAVQGVEPAAIDERIFLRFLVHERRRGLSDKTLADRHLALGIFFRWCEQRKYFGGLRSPATVENRPKVSQKEPRWVSLDQYVALQASLVGDGWLDARDRLLLAVMFRCGLRSGEVTGLALADVDLARRRLKVRAESSKSKRDRYVPFNPEVDALLNAYLSQRLQTANAALFLSDNGYGGVRGPLTVYGVRPMLLRRCARVGLPYVNAHSFRHGFAMTMLNEGGAEMSSVAALLGHTSVTTTEKAYARWLSEPLQRAYDAAQARLG